MGVFEFIIALVSIVMGCVTLWLIMFYGRRGKRTMATLEPNGRYDMNQLSSMAESMQERIRHS